MGLKAVTNPAAGGQPGSFTDLTVTEDLTLSNGTANGVAYLNGSKIVTTGSALTFSGANFGVGATLKGWSAGINAAQVNARSAAWANPTTFFLSNNVYTDGTDRRIEAAEATRYYQSGTSHIWEYAGSGAADSAIAFGEAMRATPTGLDVTGQIETDTLRVNVSPVAETPTATHTAVINFAGTNYRVLCVPVP